MFTFDNGNGHKQRFRKYVDARSALEAYIDSNGGAFDEDVSNATIYIECAELEPNIIDDGSGGVCQSGWNIYEGADWKYLHRSNQISVQERNAMMAKLTAMGLVDIDDEADSDGNYYFKWTETGKRLCDGIADDPQEVVAQ